MGADGKGLSEKQVLARTRATSLEDVQHLNCWGSRITEATLLQKMPNIEVITLSMNKLTSLKYFERCRALKELYLRKNQIKDLEELAYLKELPELSVLWMSDNPVADHDNYRATVIRNLTHLTKLDNQDITDDERKEAEEKGMLVSRDALPPMEEDLAQEQTPPPPQEQQHKPQQQVSSSASSVEKTIPRLSASSRKLPEVSPQQQERTHEHGAPAGQAAFAAIKELLPLLSMDQLKELRSLAKKQILRAPT